MENEKKLEPETTSLVAQPKPDLVMLALDKGLSMDNIGKLIEYQERLEKYAAKQEYVSAMLEFQKDPPKLYKDKTVSYETSKGGTTTYKHETLPVVVKAIKEKANPLGLSFHWESSTIGDKIRITCVVTHKRGHSESCYLDAPPDVSGGKNGIQGIGSSTSYVKRYTVEMMFGLSAENEDNDGRTTGMDENILIQLCDSLESASSYDELKKNYEYAFGVTQKNGDKEAQKQIIAIKDKKLAEIKAKQKKEKK